MTSENSVFLVLNPKELRDRLHLSADFAKDIGMIDQDTPSNLKNITHYALAWGIDDDGYRRDFIQRAPEQMKKNLKWVVSTREDELDDWLAGPEATGDTFTRAYIAFSNMRIASDEIVE